MLRLVACVTQQHDVWLVGLAVLVCAIACVTAIHLFDRGLAAAASRHAGDAAWAEEAWRIGAAVAFGSGVWATHFLAMLAFRPGLPFGFAVPLTLASLVIPIVGAWLALSLVAGAPSAAIAQVAGGLLIGLSVALMHFIGMGALLISAQIEADNPTRLAAIGFGVLLSVAALFAHRAGRSWSAAGLLGLGVCGLHFTAMSALSLVPDGHSWPADEALTSGTLGVAIALVIPLMLLGSLVASLLDADRNQHVVAETRRLRRLLDATFEGILIHENGRVTETNAQLCALLGCEREALLGSDVQERLGLLSFPTVTPNGQPVSVETEIIDAAGRTHPVELLARALADTSGEQVLAVRDLSERKLSEERIAHFAQHDTLTGLANRVLFNEILRQALAQADRTRHSVALLCLDLDGFKSANDLLSYASGDLLLKAVAGRLRTATRRMDTVARIGGDEFAVLQPVAAGADATAGLGERIVRLLSQPFEIGGQVINISASVGIAVFPSDATAPEDLLRKADLALYRAKRDSKGTYRFFEPGMDAQMQQRRELELDLRGALNANQFTLHYQGLFDTRTLEPVGFEALLRWDHPRLGRISPAVFIPIAEGCGLIGDIGDWVLQTACAEAVGWPGNVRLSVNLSPAQFKRAGLMNHVKQTLLESGLPPSRLELEITEGVLIDDTERAQTILSDLRKHGIRLALDDFGTGYSSLGYLRRFPFHTLKIDKSFVQGIGQDPGSDAIVRAVIGLGRSLDLDVIAEGVETTQQLAFLRGQKCTLVQGFLLARPVPAEELLHAIPQQARA
jgi:diguanylate cyclase (GGDEF)-like protein/PAS domain S-box-containing protein